MADSKPSSPENVEEMLNLSISMKNLPTGVISSSNLSQSQRNFSISEQGLGHTHIPDLAGPSSQVRNFLSLDLNSALLSYPSSPIEKDTPNVVDSLVNQPGNSLGLSENLFEGDLPVAKNTESNILAASEELVIQRFTLMRNTEIDFLGFNSEIRQESEGNVAVNEENIEGEKLVEGTDAEDENLGEEIVGVELVITVTSTQTKVVSAGEIDVPEECNIDKDDVQVEGNIANEDDAKAGKVIDPVYIGNPGLRELVDDLEIQGWNHLFSFPIPVLYEKDVRDFYYNMEITQDGSINSLVNGELIHLNEEILGKCLKVSVEGIKSVAGRQASPGFIDEISKIPGSNKTSVAKKFLKGVYQMYFEFVNKNVLPRTEKRNVATATDLFMIETLSKMDEISLPAIMIEHMIKIKTKKDGRHGLAYGYLLGRVFKERGIRLEKGIKGTMKKVISLNTLIECECIEARGGKKGKSQISQLIDGQEQLRNEVEELTVLLTQKDVEIVKLKAQIAKSSAEGSGFAEIEMLRKQNVKLSAKVEDLTNKLLKSHEEADARLSLVLQTFQSRPPQNL